MITWQPFRAQKPDPGNLCLFALPDGADFRYTVGRFQPAALFPVIVGRNGGLTRIDDAAWWSIVNVPRAPRRLDDAVDIASTTPPPPSLNP